MPYYQKEMAPLQRSHFEEHSAVEFTQVNCPRYEAAAQAPAPREYMQRLGELYRAGKHVSKTGLSRGVTKRNVLRGATRFALCSRGGLDALDAWQATLDAWRAALAESAGGANA